MKFNFKKNIPKCILFCLLGLVSIGLSFLKPINEDFKQVKRAVVSDYTPINLLDVKTFSGDGFTFAYKGLINDNNYRIDQYQGSNEKFFTWYNGLNVGSTYHFTCGFSFISNQSYVYIVNSDSNVESLRLKLVYNSTAMSFDFEFVADTQYFGLAFYCPGSQYVDIYNPILSPSLGDSGYSSGYTDGQLSVIQNPGDYDLITFDEAIDREERAEQNVINNPNDFGLYNQIQFEAEYQRGYDTGIRETNGIFTSPINLFARVFDAIGGIASIEIFPNVSIGFLMFLPLVAIVVVFLVKILTA